MVLPLAIRPDFNSLFKCLLSSRADSTVKKYLKEINKFLLWCSNCATKKPAIIRSIIDRYGAEEASLKDLRIAAISSLGFAGFFRFNDLANIQPKHLTLCDGFVKIFVPRSKTDVYREGNYVYITKLENKYCPVAILRRYIEAANLDLSNHLPLFRPLTKNKSGYLLGMASYPILAAGKYQNI
ncbi:unnamed protein product [Porites lobata]|uniref:Uncharacterized protein n=1 Tax=Porites lobata TaxID=104759 RepID=A0ABN8P2E4_9CNID|nr:unnamed protein product [Porites lobata]